MTEQQYPQQGPTMPQAGGQPYPGMPQPADEGYGPHLAHGQAGPYQQWYAPAPQPVRRRTGMFVVGIILTALGALMTLAQLVATGSGTGGSDPTGPYALMTYLVLSIILGPGLLVVGIVMIVRSKRR